METCTPSQLSVHIWAASCAGIPARKRGIAHVMVHVLMPWAASSMVQPFPISRTPRFRASLPLVTARRLAIAGLRADLKGVHLSGDLHAVARNASAVATFIINREHGARQPCRIFLKIRPPLAVSMRSRVHCRGVADMTPMRRKCSAVRSRTLKQVASTLITQNLDLPAVENPLAKHTNTFIVKRRPGSKLIAGPQDLEAFSRRKISWHTTKPKPITPHRQSGAFLIIA